MREVKKEGPIEIGHQGGWREGAAGRGKGEGMPCGGVWYAHSTERKLVQGEQSVGRKRMQHGTRSERSAEARSGRAERAMARGCDFNLSATGRT